MRPVHLLRLVALLLVQLTVSTRSEAAPVSVKFCARYAIDLSDAFSTTGDDYLVGESSIPARGMHLTIIRNAYGLNPPMPVPVDPTNDGDTEPGCTTTLTLDSARSYSVTMTSEATVNGNTIHAYDDSSTPTHASYSYYTALYPSAGTYTITTPLSDDWNNAAVAGFALYRRTGGMTGQSYNVYSQPCPGGDYSCCDDEELFVDNTDADPRKYIIAHELGHCMMEKANEGIAIGSSYALDQGVCNNFAASGGSAHEMNSKEYGRAALSEGWAHYFAAVAFNQTDETDCKFYYYKNLDWDHDDVGDGEFVVNCAAGMPAFSVDAADYVGDYCLGSGLTTNVGTEYDYLRFFWDLDTLGGMHLTDIIRIIDGANPQSCAGTGSGSGPSYVEYELAESADNQGWDVEWNGWANYDGVDQ